MYCYEIFNNKAYIFIINMNSDLVVTVQIYWILSKIFESQFNYIYMHAHVYIYIYVNIYITYK